MKSLPQFLGLIMFVLVGYVAGMAALDWRNDPALAVFVACFVTSVMQRGYSIAGRYK